MFDHVEYRRKRSESGLCIECGEPSEGRLRCKECRRKNTEAQKARALRNVVDGKCRMCGQLSVFGEHNYCEGCLVKANAATRKSFAKKITDGRCTTCGKYVESGKRCDDCRVKANANTTALRKKRKEAGRCRDCGKEPQLTDMTKKRVSFYCRTCYLKTMARYTLGSASQWRVLLEKLHEADWRCSYTGEKLVLGVNLSFDHIFPVKRFPERKHDATNIEPVSLRINLLKRDLTRVELMKLVSKISRWARKERSRVCKLA